MDVLEALARLDPENDDLWTAQGVPRVEAVSAILGRDVTRQEITDASHDFDRSVARNMAGNLEPDDGEEQPEPDDVPLAAESQPLEVDTSPDTDAHVRASTEHLPAEPFSDAEIKAAELNDAANAKMEEAVATEKEIDRLMAKKAQLLREADALVQQRERILPSPTEAQARRAFLDRQAEIRAEKAMNRDKVLQHLDSRDIAKGSPIDQAMARKRGRGTKRPERALRNNAQAGR